MPVVLVDEDHFCDVYNSRLGKRRVHVLMVTRSAVPEFEAALTSYGLDFDGIQTNPDGTVALRVEVPNNRPDLLSTEGIAECLSVFQLKHLPPVYELPTPTRLCEMTVDPSVNRIRPFCFCGVLRNVNLTPKAYKSFIDLQEKLAFTLGKRRQIVAVGTHDLDTLGTKFTYTAENPANIRFVPLGMKKEMNSLELLETLKSHAQLKVYVPILEGSEVFPVIRDERGVVLSLPPILNSEHTKIVPGKTKNILIEVTATDAVKGSIAVKTILALFSRYSSDSVFDPTAKRYRLAIEPVLMRETGQDPSRVKEYMFPQDIEYKLTLSADYVRRLIGVPALDRDTMILHLQQMMLAAQGDPSDPDLMHVACPLTRSDVLHACDLAEDIATAYGYEKIPTTKYKAVQSIPELDSIDALRSKLSHLGYHEALNWGLLATDDLYPFIGGNDNKNFPPSSPQNTFHLIHAPIRVSNPKAINLECVRPALLPSLLKTVKSNSDKALPLKLFEVGHCEYSEGQSDYSEGLSDTRIAAVYCNTTSGLETIHGLLDAVLDYLHFTPVYGNDALIQNEVTPVYELLPCDDSPAFLPKRCVKVRIQATHEEIGMMGVVHPHVLEAFKINLPCSAFELSFDRIQSILHRV